MKARFMLSLFFLTLAGLILAGCVATPSDPYTLQAAGNQALDLAHAQMTSTAAAAIAREESAILQQAQTQASNDNSATATAQIIQAAATGTALHFQALATQEAQTIQATQQALELFQLQQGATATQNAVIILAERERAQLNREKVVTVGGWLAVGVLFVLACVLGFQLAQWAMKTATGKRSWVEGANSFAYDTGQGLTVVSPGKMFQAALQLDGHGRATMPLLTAPQEQLYTTLAALAVLLEREKSKKPQWFTPVGKNGHGESMHALETETPAQLPMPQLQPLPMLSGRHLLIAGATGAGKTHAARYLLSGRENATVLDPHSDGATWPGHCTVIGAGRDFSAIAQSIEEARALLDNRYKMRGMGTGANFDPVTLVVDEIPALIAHQPDIAKTLMQIGMEGRKVGLYLVLLSQSVLVRSLGIEGQGDLRENFATIRLDPLPAGVSEDTPRQCTVITGSLVRPESEEKFMVPSLVPPVPNGARLVPALVPPVPMFTKYSAGTVGNLVPVCGNHPQPGTAEENALIKDLAGRGFGAGKIADLLGGRRKDTLGKIRAVLGVVSV